MPRLFVAVDLPAAAIAPLTGLQPIPMAGIRLVPPEQIHLTLHFLGEAAIEPVAKALESVKLPAFQLTIKGVGRFRSAGGGATLWAGLWAGIQDNPQLQQLHASIRAALAITSFKPEPGRYMPHITLARCKPTVSTHAINMFLRNKTFTLKNISVTAFRLYSSTLAPDGPVHHCERSYPLAECPYTAHETSPHHGNTT